MKNSVSLAGDGGKKMNRLIRWHKLCKKFPWLKKIPKANVDLEISIKRLGTEELRFIPDDTEGRGSRNYYLFYFVIKGRVTEFKVEGRGVYGCPLGEPVIRALVRQDLLDKAKQAEALCVFHHFYDDSHVDTVSGKETLTVYLPKVNIASVLAEIEAEEQARLDAELAGIKE